jgi:hypothetical protein
MDIARGDPSKAASVRKQRVVMGGMYLLWDGAFFLGQGHTLAGLVGLTLPLAWFALAWRSGREGRVSEEGTVRQ